VQDTLTARALRRRSLVAAPLLAWAAGASAQSRFPDHAITLVVPFAPGGVADLTARAVAEAMARSLGQAVVVDNRPSAGSIVATAAVAKAAPDGHTLLLMSNSNALSASLFKRLPFEVTRDFAPISTLGFFDLGIFVAANSRFNQLSDVLAAAKAQPAKLTVGTIAVGSTQHLAAEYFKSMAGIDVLVVPYRGSPAVLTALRAGEIDLAFEIVAPMLGQLGPGGMARALAVSAESRHPALPQVPTVQESGLPRYAVASWNALAAPAGTPAAVVERLNRAVREALASSAVQERLAPLGVRLRASTPEQLQSLLIGEIRRWAEVIRVAKIEAE
jgi:tripartite-type tricarboxylate transporter receptor subunit TctC